MALHRSLCLTISNLCSIMGTSLLVTCGCKGEMQNMKKDADYYRRKIIDLINKTDDLWILDHILKFIQGMTKERE